MLHRLSLVQKFLVLSLLALVMILLPTGLYFSNVIDQVHVAQIESKSSASVTALNHVVQLVQTHRGMAAGALNGNADLAARRPTMRDEVVKAIAVLDQALVTADAPANLQKPWMDLKAQWRQLEEGVAGKKLTSAESTQQHTQWIAAILLLNEDLLSDCGFSLDPDADTYFLIQASLVAMPRLAENLGIMRAQGTGLLAQGSLPPENRSTLLALKKRVLELDAEMFGSLKRATEQNPDMQQTLSVSASGGHGAVLRALATADQALLNATVINFAPAAYFDEFTRSINVLYEFNSQAMKSLTESLDLRAKRLQRTQYMVIAVLVLGLLVSSALARAFVLSITEPVAHAVAIATAVAQDDLSMKVPVFGNNEFTRLMQAQLSMRDQLARVVRHVRENSESVAIASAEIAKGNQDLSARTESQASALEQTAASMEQLSTTVKQNAATALQASRLAAAASSVAVQGGNAVTQVVGTMQGISESSKKIADIIQAWIQPVDATH